jgi:hypothetical protein
LDFILIFSLQIKGLVELKSLVFGRVLVEINFWILHGAKKIFSHFFFKILGIDFLLLLLLLTWMIGSACVYLD